jgi:predicted KAP-like P-loop ATPase
MVREQLEGDEGVVCVSFNGWPFEGCEDAKAALMGTILDEVTTNGGLSRRHRSWRN